MVKPLETSSARYGIVYMAQNGLQSNVTIEIAKSARFAKDVYKIGPRSPQRHFFWPATQVSLTLISGGHKVGIAKLFRRNCFASPASSFGHF